MRKLVLGLGLVFGVVFLNGCTDDSLTELEKRNEINQEIKLIDKDDVESPTTKG